MRSPSFIFFFNDTATTEIYTLSLHDALPISRAGPATTRQTHRVRTRERSLPCLPPHDRDRKSTRLNSSHSQISYAVFCLKKKKTQEADPLLHPAGRNQARRTVPPQRAPGIQP